MRIPRGSNIAITTPGVEFRSNYWHDPALNLDFDSLRVNFDADLLITLTSAKYLRRLRRPAYFLHLEEPNKWLTKPKLTSRLLGRHPDFQFDRPGKIKKLLTIDKFSTAEYNFPFQTHVEREYVFFPTSEQRLPPYLEWEKREFDLFYSGSIFPPVAKILNRLKLRNWKLCVVSHSQDQLVTHSNVDYETKLKLVGDSKYSIVHNQLFLNSDSYDALRRWGPKILEHGAFAHLESVLRLPKTEGRLAMRQERAPQLKSRLFEAAMVGTVPLVVRDPWSLARDWFSADMFVEFNEEDGEDLGEGLSSQFRDHSEVSRRLVAYARRNYTSQKFAELYLSDRA